MDLKKKYNIREIEIEGTRVIITYNDNRVESQELTKYENSLNKEEKKQFKKEKTAALI